MRTQFFVVFLLFITIGFAQEKPIYNIGILLDKETSEVEILLSQLQTEITAVVGEDAVVNFPAQYRLANDFNIQQAEQDYQRLVTGNADIILAFGTINSQLLTRKKAFSKPTILFGAVNADFIDLSETLNTSGIPNFTYLITSRSFKADLETFKTLTNFTNVGIVTEQYMVDDSEFTGLFNSILTELEVAHKMIPYTTAEDILAALNGVDAVYFSGGFYLSEADIKKVAKALIDLKIPSFTSTGIEDVTNGLMATNQAGENINQFFRRIALGVEAVIGGDDLSEFPIYVQSENRLTVNFKTTRQLGVPLKYSLIATTHFVGDLNELPAKKKYNLLDVMREAMAENLLLKSSQRDVEISEQDVKLARSNYLPEITASATGAYVDPDIAEVSNGQNPEVTTTGNLTLKQTLFSEAANANISIQKALQLAQQENYNSDALNTVFDASFAYFRALIIKANAQIQSRNLDLTKRNLQISEQNYEAGQAGKSDVLRFRSQLAQNTQVFIEAVNQVKQAFYDLNQLLNNPIDLEVDVDEAELGEGLFQNYNYQNFANLLDDPTLREPFANFLVREAIANAPELKALAHNLEATERSVKLYGAGRLLPTVGLQGQYINEFSRSGAGATFPQGFPVPPDGYYNAGVSISIPILDGNRQNINKQAALIQKDQLDINAENLKLNIEKNVKAAVLELTNQIANIELSKVSERTAKEALDLTQTAYTSGAVNIVQLLDAQNNYLQAQLSRITATYNFLISSMTVERGMGYFFLMHTQEENQEFIQRFMTFSNSKN